MGFLVDAHNLPITLAVLVLLARFGDIGSTYLATPTLAMESNPLMRAGGWWLAGTTVLACLIPFWSAPLGLTMLVLSLMVTGSNLSKGWLMQALGAYGFLGIKKGKKAFLAHVAPAFSQLERSLARIGEFPRITAVVKEARQFHLTGD